MAARGLSEDELFVSVEKTLRKYFGRRGEKVIRDNMAAVTRGYRDVNEVDNSIMTAGHNKAAKAG